MRVAAAFLLQAVLVCGFASAQTATGPISSLRNVIDSDVQTSIVVTPLDGSGATMPALAQNWPAAPRFQETTALTFPASPSAYVLSGFRAEIVLAGTGFVTNRALLLDSRVAPLSVPAGVTVQATITAPLSGLGVLAVTLGPDGLPPSAPVLSATPAQTSANLAWTASIDNVGVVGYILERSIGTVGPFAQIALTTATSFADSGLTSATVFSYRVRASDAAGNSSPYSNVAVAMTLAPPPPVPAVSPDGSCLKLPAVIAACSAVPSIIDSTGAIWTIQAQTFGTAAQIGLQRCLAGACKRVANSIDYAIVKLGKIYAPDFLSGNGWQVWNGTGFVSSPAP